MTNVAVIDKKAIGKKIRGARRRKGWTQQELGDRFGCSQSNVSDMERGDISLDLAALGRLAEILDEGIFYFLSEEQAGRSVSSGLCRTQLEEAVRIFLALPDDAFRLEMAGAVLALAQYAQRRVCERFENADPSGDMERR